MTTEKLVIYESKTVGGMYYNKTVGFYGDIHDAKEFARQHNFSGGVEIYNPQARKFRKA